MNASGIWTVETMEDGTEYSFCSCGMVSWDLKKCLKGHRFGYVYKPRKPQHRFSGFSQHQKEVDGFQRSSHA